MDIHWFFLSLIALGGFGLQSFVYKEAAIRGLRSRTIVFWFSLLTCGFLWLFVLLYKEEFAPRPYLILLSLADAFVYYISSVSRLEALRFIPAHLAFLILRANIILIFLYAACILNESITYLHILAFLLLLFIAWLIHLDREKDRLVSSHYRLGLLLISLATVTSASTHIISKYAGQSGQILEYMTLANTLLCVFALVENWYRAKKKSSLSESLFTPTLAEFVVAFLAGAANLVAWSSGLIALKSGPLSGVSFIMGMSFIVPIVLSVFFHQERPSLNRVLGIALALVVLFLLKVA